MNLINPLLLIIFCLLVSSCKNSSFPKCFYSQPNDSSSFAQSLAMSDRYLAIGDSRANRVIIYTRDRDGQWLRTKEILPPKDSIPDKYNSGFGANLVLDKSTLVILALIQKAQYEVIDREDFQKIGDKFTKYRFKGVYKTNLNKNTDVERLDDHKNKKLPSSFTADGGKIAFSISRIEATPTQEYDIQFELDEINILFKDKRRNLYPLLVAEGRKLGKTIKMKNNLLLVSASIKDLKTAGWLFDLEHIDRPPKEIVTPEDFLGSSIELSEKFIVAGTSSWRRYRGTPKIPPKTLITSIKTGANRMIDGYGKLSLDGNILARLRYANPSIKEENLLEVFRLANDATPRRIIRREKIKRALVYNNLLTTVQKTESRIKVCIEKVH